MPNVTTKVVFLTLVVDAWEGHIVVVMDLLGAFMQTDMDELVHVWFHGEMVSKLFEINHELYSPYMVEEKEVQVMYVELLKALYRTLCMA